MKRILRIAMAALALGCAVPLHAQGSQPIKVKDIREGTQVRALVRGSWREGTLAARLRLTSSDTVLLTGASGSPERIPMSGLGALQILERASRSDHAAGGFLLGAALGAGVAFAAGQGISLAPGGSKGENAGGLAIAGGVLGGLLGGAVGAAFPSRAHWRDVELPGS